MAKKLKKQRKGMSPKAKFTLINAGKGIISNQACIDGSKESPWWVAAIFFVVAVILPLIPGFAKLNKAKGSDFLASANYGFDTSLTALAYDMYQNDEDFVAKNGTLRSYRGDGPVDDIFVTPDDAYIYGETHQEEFAYVNTATGQIDLRVFFWTGLKESKLKKYVNAVSKQKFIIGTTDYPDPEVKDKYYIPNIMIITPKTMAIALYKSNTTTQVQTSYGGLDWENTGKTGIIKRILKDGIKSGDISTMDKGAYLNNYSGKTLKRFKVVLNETYLNQKRRTTWSSTGIYAGIYAGIIVFLGLMIFILTRGKNNPFKFLNIWHCQKIAWWAAFTPALLGMILAFVFSGNTIGQMAFILLVSLRVMWLSMKQLRPVYQGQ